MAARNGQITHQGALLITKDPLEISRLVTLYFRKRERTTNILFLVVEKLAIDVLLRTGFIDEQTFVIHTDSQKVTIQKTTSIRILKQHDVPANVVFSMKNTQNAVIKAHFEAKDDQVRQSNTVCVAKQKLLEPISVPSVMLTTIAKGLLCFGPEPILVIQGRLTAKHIVGAISVRPFIIFVTKNFSKPQKITKHKIMVRPNGHKANIVSMKAPHKSSQHKKSLSCVLGIVMTGKESSPPTSQNQK